MVDRIRELLLARQLSPTQFADTIGLARPIVSHILSGRNKPSLEVVQKIRAAFPDLSMPWLLDGSGPMLAATSAPVAAETAPAAASAPRRRPSGPAPSVPRGPAVPDPAAASDEPVSAPAAQAEPALPAPPAPRVESLPLAEAIAPAALAVPPAAPAPSVPPEVAFFAEPGKAIRRIVIFYRDGTFADYQPE